MAVTIIPAPASRDWEFSLHILKHRRDDGTHQYTVGIWEGTVLRAICHAGSISTALLAVSGELEGTGHSPTVAYPRWSDTRELVQRLGQRADADCVAAAGHLEDLHARLHNAVSDLETVLDRLTKIGSLIEEAAAKSRCVGDSEWTTVAVPDNAWFQLLAVYRGKEEGNQIYRELHVLREVAGITAQTIRAIDNWLGNAGTRESAMDSLWRLMRILQAAGYKQPLEHLEWRGQLVRAMEEAGVGLGDDGNLRVRQPEDRYWEPATGALIKEVLQSAQPQPDLTSLGAQNRLQP